MEPFREAEADLWVSLATFEAKSFGTVELVRILSNKGWNKLCSQSATQVGGEISRLRNLANGPVPGVFVDDDDYFIGFAIIRRQDTYRDKFFTADVLLMQVLPGAGVYDIHMTSSHSLTLYHIWQRKVWLWLLLVLLNIDPDELATQIQFLMAIPALVSEDIAIEMKSMSTEDPAVALNFDLLVTETAKGLNLKDLAHEEEVIAPLKAAADLFFRPLVQAGVFSRVRRAVSYDTLTYQVWLNDLVPILVKLPLEFDAYRYPRKRLWSVGMMSGDPRQSERLMRFERFVGGEDLVHVLHKAGLWLPEEDWLDWYDNNVLIAAEKLYPIDPEPYLLLDAGNPYLWPNDKLKALLKEV